MANFPNKTARPSADQKRLWSFARRWFHSDKSSPPGRLVIRQDYMLKGISRQHSARREVLDLSAKIPPPSQKKTRAECAETAMSVKRKRWDAKGHPKKPVAD